MLMTFDAPNSSAASISRTPSVPTLMAKKPPPPSSDTVRLNGRCRSEKLKRTSAGLASNGSRNPAPSERCSSAKIPTASDGTLIE